MTVCNRPARPGLSCLARAAGVAVAALMTSATSGQTSYADWAQPVDGFWHDASEWSPQAVPGVDAFPTYTRISGTLDEPEYWVTLGAGPAVSLDTLLLRTNGGVRLDGGSLFAEEISIIRGRLEIASGSLRDTRLSGSGEAWLTSTSADTRLHNLTLATMLRAEALPDENMRLATMTGGLTFDGGSIRLKKAQLTIFGDVNASGTGEVLFGDSGSSARSTGMLAFKPDNPVGYPAADTATIGAGVTIRTAGGDGNLLANAGHTQFHLINYGTISAETPGDILQIYGAGSHTFENRGLLRAANGGILDVQLGSNGGLGSVEITDGGLLIASGAPQYVIDQPVTVPTGGVLHLRRTWRNTGGITVDGGTLELYSSESESFDMGTVDFVAGSSATIRLGGAMPLDALSLLGTASDTTLAALSRFGSRYVVKTLLTETLDLDDYVGTWDLNAFTFTGNGETAVTDAAPQADYLPDGGEVWSRNVRFQLPLFLNTGDAYVADAGTRVEAPITVDAGGQMSMLAGATVGSGGSVTVLPDGALLLHPLDPNGPIGPGGGPITFDGGGMLKVGGGVFRTDQVAALPIGGTPDEYQIEQGALDLEGATLRPMEGPIPWKLGHGTVLNGTIDAAGEGGPFWVVSNGSTGSTTLTGHFVVDATASTGARLNVGNGSLLTQATVDSIEPPGLSLMPWQSRFVVHADTVVDQVTLNTRSFLLSRNVQITGGIEINDVTTIGPLPDAPLTIKGTQTAGGTGLLVFNSYHSLFGGPGVGAGATTLVEGAWTIAPTLTVGFNAAGGRLDATEAGGLMINHGRLVVDPSLEDGWAPASATAPVLTMALDALHNAADGRIEVADAGTLRVESPLENLGTVTVAAGGLAVFVGDVVNNGSFHLAPGTMTRFDGRLSGAGAFAGGGDVSLHGTVAPGNSPAIVHFEGDVAFGEGSRLEMEIGGPVSGSEYDQLALAGTATLDGVLSLELIDGYSPAYEERYTLITANEVIGRFDRIAGILPPSDRPLALATYFDSDGVEVLVTLPGDANGDLSVDFSDFLALRSGFGSSGDWINGDFNGDRRIDFSDFLLLRSNFGRDAGGGGGSMNGWGEVAAFESIIPEPGGVAALLTAVAAAVYRRPSRRPG